MGSAIAGWLAANRDVYIGNATAVRDFRVQLRGNRSVMLFALYLFILIGVALFVYSTSTGTTGTTIIEAQMRLRQFYQLTMGLLGLTVCVVAPALTATTIVMERQRQSIDLIFSAPVSPKYYLVGKMISSFRYTWMLLVLALPIAAASVVLGGASWSDVLVAYLLLSIQGLILTAIALLMSTVAPKPVSAIIWSYAVAIFYNVCAFGISEAATYMLRAGRGSSGEAPFFITLSPWTVSDAARTYTTVASHHVPNWIFMLVIALLVIKICLLGAGTLLSASGGKEIVGLRLCGFLYVLAIAAYGGAAIWPTMKSVSASSFGGWPATQSGMCGVMITWASAPLVVFVPFLSCFGFDRERRFRPNGFFGLRSIFDGTPAGGLPFLWLLMIGMFGGFALGAWYETKDWLALEFWGVALYATAMWTFFWSVGRLASSIVALLKTSRVLVFAIFVLLVALPFPFLAVAAGIDPEERGFTLWNLYILDPIIGQHNLGPNGVYAYSGVLIFLSVVMLGVAETRTQNRLSKIRNYDEQPFQTAEGI